MIKEIKEKPIQFIIGVTLILFGIIWILLH